MTAREKHTARYLYPGLFMPEDTSREITAPTFDAALLAQPNDGWYAVEISTTTLHRFVSDDGEERWLSVGTEKHGRWLVGEVLDVAQVEALPGDYHILLANMRGNDWPRVVRTRCGNFQPLTDDTQVVPA